MGSLGLLSSSGLLGLFGLLSFCKLSAFSFELRASGFELLDRSWLMGESGPQQLNSLPAQQLNHTLRPIEGIS